MKIAITVNYRGGKKIEETYIVKNRLASRASYEKARLQFPDMPPADGSVHDFAPDLLKAVRAEKSALAVERRRHVPDPAEAERDDAFCKELMSKGTCADTATWIEDKTHTIGERDHRSSKQLVRRLSNLGAVRIFACGVDVYEGEGQNTGHLVVELPTEQPARSKLLSSIGRLFQQQGLEGPNDNGQVYAYVKLD